MLTTQHEVLVSRLYNPIQHLNRKKIINIGNNNNNNVMVHIVLNVIIVAIEMKSMIMIMKYYYDKE